MTIQIKTKDLYKGSADDVRKTCDTSNFEINRPLTKVSINKCLGKVSKVMTEFVCFRPKTPYLIEDANNGNAEEKKKCVIKQRLTSEEYKKCLLNNKIISKSEQRFRGETHNL